jgi:nicotinamidase-related amidase
MEDIMISHSKSGLTIDTAKTALLLIHWQNEIASPAYKYSGNNPERLAAARTIEHTQAALQASRERGVLVIYVNASHRPGHPELPPKRAPIFGNVIANNAHVRGTKGAEVIEQLKPLDDEIIICNYSPSAFCYTDLDLVLRNKDITDLVLSGISTNWAVETTARDGACMGYFIYTLRDCCNSSSDEMHNWPLTNILPRLGLVIDSDSYIAALKRKA